MKKEEIVIIILFVLISFGLIIFVLANESINNKTNVSEISNLEDLDNNEFIQNNFLEINTSINDSEINNLTNNTLGNESIIRNDISLSFRPRVEDIIEVKVKKEEVSQEIIKISEEYIKSFVNEDNFNKNFRFDRVIIFKDHVENSNKYLIIYNFRIDYIRNNGKRAAAGSDLKILIDESGKVLNPLDGTNKYENFILKKI